MNSADLAIWKYFSATAFPNAAGYIQDIPVERTDYASNGIAYEGIAPWGSLASDAKWLIHRLTYDGSGNLTLKESSHFGQIWNNRATSVVYG